MSPIQAVLFDYGMVLSGPPDPTAHNRLRNVFAIDSMDHPTFESGYWKFRDAYDRGALNADTYWPAVAAHLNQPLTAPQLAELVAADTALWTQPNQPMIEWAAALQRAGIKTGILSNIGDAMEAGILARFPWLHDFTHHTFSHRLGIAKPDPAIYRHAVEGLAVPPSSILFIDDREENITAALAAGMNAIQYTNHAAFLATMKARGFADLLDPHPEKL